MRVAAVDCGTNSIRLLVADIERHHKVDVHREMRVVRLGEGVDRSGAIAAEALERTRVALVDYAAVCADLEVDQIRMVATSATRDASNRGEFVEMVDSVLHAAPEVITGDEEAALSFLGATAELVERQPVLVLDIGGGSTELVLGDSSVTAAYSMDIGCVRLTERHLRDDPPTVEQIDAARADIDAALSVALRAVPAAEARTMIGVAGSVTTVAALALGLSSYQPEQIHQSVISAEDIHAITDMLLAMTRSERAALAVMHPGRVDVIGGGALVLDQTMQRLGLDQLTVSETDILDGIALSMGTG